jgi:hypothetical protein
MDRIWIARVAKNAEEQAEAYARTGIHARYATEVFTSSAEQIEDLRTHHENANPFNSVMTPKKSVVEADPAFKKLERIVGVLAAADGRLASATESEFDDIVKVVGTIDQEIDAFAQEMSSFRDFESAELILNQLTSFVDALQSLAEGMIEAEEATQDADDIIGGILEMTGVGVILAGVLDVLTGIVDGLVDAASTADDVIQIAVQGVKQVGIIITALRDIIDDGVSWNAMLGLLKSLDIDTGLLDDATEYLDHTMGKIMEAFQHTQEQLDILEKVARVGHPHYVVAMRNLTPVDITSALSPFASVLTPLQEKNLLPMHAVGYFIYPVKNDGSSKRYVVYVISVGDEKTILELVKDVLKGDPINITNLKRICLNKSMFYAEKWEGEIDTTTKKLAVSEYRDLVKDEVISKTRISTPPIKWDEGSLIAENTAFEHELRTHIQNVTANPRKNRYCLFGPNCQTQVNNFIAIGKRQMSGTKAVQTHRFEDGGLVLVDPHNVAQILASMESVFKNAEYDPNDHVHNGGVKHFTQHGSHLAWTPWNFPAPRLPQITDGDSLSKFGQGTWDAASAGLAPGSTLTIQDYHAKILTRWNTTTRASGQAKIDAVRLAHADKLNRFGYLVVTASPLAGTFVKELQAEGGVPRDAGKLKVAAALMKPRAPSGVPVENLI